MFDFYVAFEILYIFYIFFALGIWLVVAMLYCTDHESVSTQLIMHAQNLSRWLINSRNLSMSCLWVTTAGMDTSPFSGTVWWSTTDVEA